MKRGVIFISIVLLLTTIVTAGCNTTSTSSPDNSKNQVSLTFFNWRNEDKATYDALIKQFEQKNPGITVKNEIVTTGQYTSTLMARLMGQSPGDVFMMHTGSEFLTSASSNGLVDLAGQSMLSDYDKSSLLSGQYNGKQYAVASTANLEALVYNKDIFQKLNLSVPTNWDEFLKVCDALKNANYIPIVNGGGEVWPISTGWVPMIVGITPDIKKFAQDLDAKKIKANDPIYTEILKTYQALSQHGYYPQSNLSTKYDQASALFAQGKAGMIMDGSWAMASWLQTNPKLNFDFFNMPLPDGKQAKGAIVLGALLGVSSHSKHITEAEKFLQFLSEPDNASVVSNGTGQIVLENNLNITNQQLQKVISLKSSAVPSINYYLQHTAYNDALNDMISRVVSGQSIEQAEQQGQTEFDAVH